MKNDPKTFKFPFKMSHVAVLFAVAITFLAGASLVATYYRDVVHVENQTLLRVISKLDLDLEENNLPTWYQSMTLALSSFLLVTIALIRKHVGAKDAWFYTFLGAGFFYMSLDEAVSIHEHLTDILRTFTHMHGIFYFAWVVPGLLIVGTVGLLSLRALFKMQPKYRYLMMASGFVYVMGIIGLEMIGGRYYEFHLEGEKVMNMTYNVMTTTEEIFEMSGIAMFITTLLSFIQNAAFVTDEQKEVVEEPFRGSISMNELLPAPSPVINFTAVEEPSKRVRPLAQHQFANRRAVR